jgi:2-dehydropantoate 2-reductase
VRIAVFGTGGVGGYFGGRLAEAGEDVTFIARGAHLAAMREHGLRVSSIDGDFVLRGARFTDDPSTVGSVDIVLLAVKAWHVPDAIRAMPPLIGDRTCIVPLENGVEAPEQLSNAFGADHVLGGLCRIFAVIAEPGHIVHSGVAPFVAFGELGGSVTDRVRRVSDAFGRAHGVRVEIPSDIRVAMWSKLLLIAPWSGLGALARVPVGVLRAVPETREVWKRALDEVQAVASANEVGLPEDVVQSTLRYIDGLPAGGVPSMQRDVVEGRPSELDAQVGAVVRLGRRAGVNAPVHALMYAMLLPLERLARGELSIPD